MARGATSGTAQRTSPQLSALTLIQSSALYTAAVCAPLAVSGQGGRGRGDGCTAIQSPTVKVHLQGGCSRMNWKHKGRLRFEVITAVTMKNAVFWDVMPCE
jgi:hypothetical protein